MGTEWFECVGCEKRYHTDGFPAKSEDLCWGCSWSAHMDNEHPLTWRERRKVRRQAKRAARTAALSATRTGQAAAVISAAREFDTPTQPNDEGEK